MPDPVAPGVVIVLNAEPGTLELVQIAEDRSLGDAALFGEFGGCPAVSALDEREYPEEPVDTCVVRYDCPLLRMAGGTGIISTLAVRGGFLASLV